MTHTSRFLPAVAVLASALLVFTLISPAAASEALAKKYACSACHQLDKKAIGPSFKDIAAKYADGSVGATQLAARIKAGSSGKWGGPMAMPPQAHVAATDLDTLAAWILAAK